MCSLFIVIVQAVAPAPHLGRFSRIPIGSGCSRSGIDVVGGVVAEVAHAGGGVLVREFALTSSSRMIVGGRRRRSKARSIRLNRFMNSASYDRPEKVQWRSEIMLPF